LVGVLALGVGAGIACGETDYTAGVYDKKYGRPEGVTSAAPEPTVVGGSVISGEGGTVGGKCDGGEPPEAGACSVSFANDIMPKLIESCGSATCHATPAGAAPQMDRASAVNTYANFIKQKAIGGKPYIDICTTDKTASGIACNIAGTPCGTGMPLGGAGSLATSPLATSIDTWLTCGAPNN